MDLLLNCDRTSQPPPLRHLLIGTLADIQEAIKNLHKRGYADPNDWSKPLPTEDPNKMMAILTQKSQPR